jgi:putative membrane protein
MTTWQLFTSTWTWHPSVLLGCAALLGGYLVAVRLRLTAQTLSFAAGILTLALALVSPLDALGDTYLFSAHMLQHLLLVLVVPPLLLFGTPAWLIGRVLNWPLARRAEQVLRRPIVAWTLGVVTLWAWHVPALYNAALASETIHILEHASFLATALILWWPILAPLEESRLAPLLALFYLFAAGAANVVLGIILTFTPPGLYPAYLHPFDPSGALPLIRDAWGISPEIDQQIGGLLMWVPGGLAYVAVAMAVLARWYGLPDEDDHEPTDLVMDNAVR